MDGVLVLPGFGHRGAEGKIEAARYARETGTPYLGLCLGMQIEVIEFARNVGGIGDGELHRVRAGHAAPGHRHHAGPGRGRDGRHDAPGPLALPDSRQDTLAEEVYGAELVGERHRHRFEVNNAYRDALENAGMIFSGTSPDGRLVEIAEIADHPFYIGSQFHPEFKSRPLRPHPLFFGFVGACKEALEEPVEAAHARRDGRPAEGDGSKRAACSGPKPRPAAVRPTGDPAGTVATRSAGLIEFSATLSFRSAEDVPEEPTLRAPDRRGARAAPSSRRTTPRRAGARYWARSWPSPRPTSARALEAVLRSLTIAAALSDAVLETRAARLAARPSGPRRAVANPRARRSRGGLPRPVRPDVDAARGRRDRARDRRGREGTAGASSAHIHPGGWPE